MPAKKKTVAIMNPWTHSASDMKSAPQKPTKTPQGEPITVELDSEFVLQVPQTISQPPAVPSSCLNSNQPQQPMPSPPLAPTKQWSWEPYDSINEQLEEMSRRHSEVTRGEDPTRKREMFAVHNRAKKKLVKLAQKRAARPMYGDVLTHHGLLKMEPSLPTPAAPQTFRKPVASQRPEPSVLPEPYEVIQIDTAQHHGPDSDEYDSSDYGSEDIDALVLLEVYQPPEMGKAASAGAHEQLLSTKDLPITKPTAQTTPADEHEDLINDLAAQLDQLTLQGNRKYRFRSQVGFIFTQFPTILARVLRRQGTMFTTEQAPDGLTQVVVADVTRVRHVEHIACKLYDRPNKVFVVRDKPQKSSAQLIGAK